MQAPSGHKGNPAMVNRLHSTPSLRTLLLTMVLFGSALVGFSTPVLADEGTAPEITGATLLDLSGPGGDSDGFLDAVEITFGPGTETIDESTLRPGDFRIGGVIPNSITTGTAGDNTVTLHFFRGTVPDTDALPEVTYIPGTARDDEGEPLPEQVAGDVTGDDGAAPRLLGASATGADDQIVLSFGEAVEAISGDPIDETHFCYEDEGTSEQTIIDASASGRIVTLTMSAALDAADIGAATVFAADSSTCDATPAASLDDAAGNEVATTNVVTVGVPAIDSAQGDVGMSRIIVEFNQAVEGASGGPLVKDDFDLTLTDGATTPVIQTVTHSAGSPIAVLNLNLPLESDHIGSGDTVDMAASGHAGTAHGHQDNAIESGAATIEDTRRPRITDVFAESLTADGFIEIVGIKFDEHVDDGTAGANLVAAPWTLYDGLDTVTIDDVVTDPGECNTTTTDGEDDDMIFLCVDAAATLTRGPTVSYTDPGGSDPRIEDRSANSNPLATRGHFVGADGTPPQVLSATTIDADGDGEIDGYEVTFSEAVDDGTFTASEWAVDSRTNIGFDTGETENDHVFIVTFDGSGTADTAATPDLTYTAGATLTDLAGNPLDDIATGDLTEEDGAPPAILSAETDDDDNDGRIDRYVVTFSEPVDDSTFDETEWGVGGEEPTGLFQDGNPDDESLTIEFDEGDDPDTDETPELTYTPGSTFRDENGVAMLAVADGDVTETDAAPPILVSAVGEAGSDELLLTFSEPVDGSGTDDVIRPIDLDYTDASGDGAGSIDSVAHTAGEATATVALDAALTSSDLGSDTIEPRSGGGRIVGTDDGLDAPDLPVTVSAAADTTPPAAPSSLTFDASETTSTSVVLEWTAPADDGTTSGSGAVDGYDIRRSESEITSSNVGSADNVPSGDITFDPSTFADPGDTQAATVGGLQVETSYYFAVRAVDDEGNEGDWAFTSTAEETDPDTTPPTGTLTITSSTHDDPSSAVDVVLAWSGASDPESSITYRYALTQSDSHTFSDSDDTTTATSLTLEDVAVGTHYFHLQAESAGGDGPTAAFMLEVTEPDDDDEQDIEQVNEDLQDSVQVTRQGGDNTITWTIPSGLDPEPEGVQLWRATSPFALLATLEADSAEYQASSYTDEGAPSDARYVVTAFFGDTEALGKGTDDLDQVPGYEETTDAEFAALGASPSQGGGGGTPPAGDDGVPTWAWVIIAIGAVFILALIIVLIIVARRPQDDGYDDEAWEDAPAYGWRGDDQAAAEETGYAWDDETAPATGSAWEDEAGAAPDDEGAAGYAWTEDDSPEGQEFTMRCPKCKNTFSERGTKPLHTECPHCGQTGVLN